MPGVTTGVGAWPALMAGWAMVDVLAHSSAMAEAQAPSAGRTSWRRVGKEDMVLTHFDDGTRAVTAANDVQQVGQGIDALGCGAGHTVEAQP